MKPPLSPFFSTPSFFKTASSSSSSSNSGAGTNGGPSTTTHSSSTSNTNHTHNNNNNSNSNKNQHDSNNNDNAPVTNNRQSSSNSNSNSNSNDHSNNNVDTGNENGFHTNSVSGRSNSANSPNSTGTSWEDVREEIRLFRAGQPSLVPSIKDFCFDDRYGRIYFLGLDPVQSVKVNTLFVADMTFENVDSEHRVIDWQPLIEPSWSFKPDKLSREEQLLRERMRIGAAGITSYQFDESSGLVMFAYGGSLFVAQTNDEPTIKPLQFKAVDGQPRMDPKLGGINKNLISFIRQKDLWVLDIRSGNERRLTEASKQPGFSCGVAEFVLQEEFHRFTGYWWAPDDSTRIMAVEIDESQVDVIYIPRHGVEGKVDEYRYPRTGTKNAQVDIVILEFSAETNESFMKSPVITRRLLGVFSLKKRFPWLEYLPRLGWMPDASGVWVQILDRSQGRLALVKLDAWEFMTQEEYETLVTRHGEAYLSSLLNPPLITDQSDIWINITDILGFVETSPADTTTTSKQQRDLVGSQPSLSLKPNGGDQVQFIWASERTGFRHLYLVTWTRLQGVCDIRALTWGPWQVVDHPICIDRNRGLVYFMAKMDTPLENHYYVVSYRQPTVILRLTEFGFSHHVTMDSSCSKFITSFSSVSTPPNNCLFDLNFSQDSLLPTVKRRGIIKSVFLPPPNLPVPRLFSFQNDVGDTIYGCVFTPQLVPGQRYPTLLKVYGGPHAQLVTNDFKFPRLLQLFLAVKMGFVVVMIDGRGSYNRGLAFESHLKHSMGTVELQDQIQGLQFLSRQYDFIDTARIAISGWSYGGYTSLMALAQRSDIFKVCVSGAPVTSWELYDTGYTEKYMGLPTENPVGYLKGSVLTYIDQFPNIENRLLIVHGLIDENVHFKNTEILVDGLIRAQKPYQLQVYPNERHGIRHPSANEHFECLLFFFLRNNL